MSHRDFVRSELYTYFCVKTRVRLRCSKSITSDDWDNRFLGQKGEGMSGGVEGIDWSVV